MHHFQHKSLPSSSFWQSSPQRICTYFPFNKLFPQHSIWNYSIPFLANPLSSTQGFSIQKGQDIFSYMVQTFSCMIAKDLVYQLLIKTMLILLWMLIIELGILNNTCLRNTRKLQYFNIIRLWDKSYSYNINTKLNIKSCKWSFLN